MGGSVTGLIENEGDEDWFRVGLESDKIYRFTVVGDANLTTPTIGALRDILGIGVTLAGDYSALAKEPTLVEFAPPRYYYDEFDEEAADFFVTVSSSGSETGSYTLTVAEVTDEVVAASFPLILGTELIHNARLVGEVSADVVGAGSIAVADPVISTIDPVDDADWFRVTLEASVAYRIDMYGALDRSS